jgi:chromosome segregation ATPase
MKTLENVQREIYAVEKKMEELRSQKFSVAEHVKQLEAAQTRLGMKQRQLQNLEQDKLDPVLERARCREDNQVQCQATCHYLHWEAMQ